MPQANFLSPDVQAAADIRSKLHVDNAIHELIMAMQFDCAGQDIPKIFRELKAISDKYQTKINQKGN